MFAAGLIAPLREAATAAKPAPLAGPMRVESAVIGGCAPTDVGAACEAEVAGMWFALAVAVVAPGM